MRKSNYDKFPFVEVPDCEGACAQGWEAIGKMLADKIATIGGVRPVVVECYTGTFEQEIREELARLIRPALNVNANDAFKSEREIDELVAPYLGGNDPLFGYITRLTLDEFLDSEKVARLRRDIAAASGLVLIIGPGALLIAPDADVLVYADLARWEAQLRQRRNEVSNLGVENRTLAAGLQYKRSFYIDWRVCDKLKRATMSRWDFVLDTNSPRDPKLVSGEAFRAGLRHAVTRPFRVVPFFDPGVWGGQWLKEVIDLDRSQPNFAWGFDCVPEENSLLLGFGNTRVEVPSIDLVFFQPERLLGEAVYGRFGAEFPIRFDFLDTMKGGNLSFQVHPVSEYAREKFGISYTQDESYYMLEAKPGAVVFLGANNGIDGDEMIADLQAAQRGERAFDDERFVARWPAKKHDHFLIPAGTLHCSGIDGVVLEISATPYMFTFKLWDWGRLGMDGKPRPINIEHGKNVIRWDRDADYARAHLINQIEPLESGDGWREERTGLHEAEFIETRRHWFTGTAPHDTHGGVNVLNLVEGEEAIVESPNGAFEPFVVHYAETFIVPAAVGAYTIRPHGAAVGQECATMKAFVRTGSER